MTVESPIKHLLLLGCLGISALGCGSSNGTGVDSSTGGGNGPSAGQSGIAPGSNANKAVGGGGTTGNGKTASSGTALSRGGNEGLGSTRPFAAGGSIGAGGAIGSLAGGSPGQPATKGGFGGNGTTGTGSTMATGGATGIGGGIGATDATIVPDPSWTCGMPEGIPSPTLGTLAFSTTLQLGATHDVGTTQYGHRRLIDVKGGTLTGDRLQATALTGGLELELTLSNGSVELEQINILRASDGTLVYMRNCGVAPDGNTPVRVVFDFEAPTSSSLAWLNSGKFVGNRVIDLAAGKIQLDVYDVSKASATGAKIQLKDPAGVPNVTWDCVTATGGKGATVFTENVTLGSSLSVGASKRGTRNIIPITGGTTTGKVVGSILAGGADYQLIGSSTKLDARYTLAPSDGEFIVVRNCGPMGALIPVFEARADGPYAFLNANTFISADPSPGTGGVGITFHERK